MWMMRLLVWPDENYSRLKGENSRYWLKASAPKGAVVGPPLLSWPLGLRERKGYGFEDLIG